MRLIAAILFSLSLVGAAYAEEKSIQPYIDSLKEGIEAKPDYNRTQENPDPYIQSIKKKLKGNETQGSQQPYIDAVKEQLSEKDLGSSYTEKEKQRLGVKQDESAIQAFKEGRSQLKAKKKGGPINNAFGFKFGPAMRRNVSASADTQQRAFSDVYGANWAPEMALYYEYQPWHSEWYGNIGFVGSFGLGYHNGQGVFEKRLTNAGSGEFFPDQSRTKFQFFSMPLTLAVDYRFNLMKYVRPFVMVGPTLIGYIESRNDSKKGHRGNSRGVYTSAGVSILLSFLSKSSDWAFYETYGARNSYITVEYSRLSPISGDVSFAVSGLSIGMLFEY